MRPDLAPLPYELTAYEKSEAAVYQCQILRQARERSEIEAKMAQKPKAPWITKPDAERWAIL